MDFRDLLIEWNGKKTKGRQSRFAKALGFKHPNRVTRWESGDNRPDEDELPRVARELRVSLTALNAALDQTERKAEIERTGSAPASGGLEARVRRLESEVAKMKLRWESVGISEPELAEYEGSGSEPSEIKPQKRPAPGKGRGPHGGNPGRAD